MAKKSNKKKQQQLSHILTLKLISGLVLTVLYILCIIMVFYFINNGGNEVLQALR